MHLIQKPRGKEKTSIAPSELGRGLWISWCLAALACIECSTPLTHSQQPIFRERIRSLSVESNSQNVHDQNDFIVSTNDWLGSTSLEVPHWMDPLLQSHPDGWYYLVARKISEKIAPEVVTTGWDLWKYHPRTQAVEIHATGLRQPFSLTQDSWGNLFVMDAIGPPYFGTRWLQICPYEDYGWMSSSDPIRRRFNQMIWDEEVAQGFSQSRYETLPFGAIHYFEGISSGLVNAMARSGSGTGAQSYLAAGNFKETRHTLIRWVQKPAGASWLVGEIQPVAALGRFSQVAWDHRSPYLQVRTLTGEASTTDSLIIGPLTRQIHNVFPPQELAGFDSVWKDPLDMLAMLEAPQPGVRLMGQQLAERAGASMLPLLLQRAQNPDHAVARLHALWAIGNMAPQELSHQITKGWMEQMLKDPQHCISQHAADLIHKVFGAEITHLLLEHLPEASPTLRCGILTALANQNQVIPLLELVKGDFFHDPALKHATARALFVSLTSGESSWEQIEGLPPFEKQLAMGELGLKVLDEHLVSYLDSAGIDVRFALADGLYRQASAGSMQMLVSWAKGFLSTSSSVEKIASECQTHPALSNAFWRRVFAACLETQDRDAFYSLVLLLDQPGLPTPLSQDLAAGMRELLKVWESMEKTKPTDLTAWVHELFHPRIDAWMQCRASEQRGLALDWLLWHQPGNDNKALVEDTFRNFFETEDNRKQALRWLGSRDIEHRMQWIAEGLQSNKAGLRTEAIILQANANPDDSVAQWIRDLEQASLKQQLDALDSLTTIADPRIDYALIHWLEKGLKGGIPQALHAALLKAAKSRSTKGVQERLKAWQQTALEIQPMMVP